MIQRKADDRDDGLIMGKDKDSNGRTNNFDFLRLLGALMVIVGHSQSIAGVPQWGVLNVTVSTLGVVIFFSLSGYLVTESWLRARSIPDFLRNRSLRILPGLLVVVTLSVFVLGPLVTTLPPSGYFRTSSTWSYFANVAFNVRYDLPGVFLANPLPVAVNGSLWTLPVEVAAYLGLLAMALIASRRLELALLFVVALLTAANIYGNSHREARFIWYATDWYQGSNVLIYFAMGAFLRSVSAHTSPFWALAAVAGAWLANRYLAVHLALAIIPLLLTCAVVGIGRMATPGVRELRRWGDPSYGMYLVGFPASQVVVAASVAAARPPDVVLVAVVSILVSTVYGYASWHLIERPCLRFKSSRRAQRTSVTDPAIVPDGREDGGVAPLRTSDGPVAGAGAAAASARRGHQGSADAGLS